MADKITLIQKNPFKAMIIMAIPLIILMFFNETYTIFDTMFLSKLGEEVLVAFGYISNIYYFINRFGKGMGRGVSSMEARLIGGKKYDKLSNIAMHGILLIVITIVIIQIIFILFSHPIINSFVPEEQFPHVLIYLQCLMLFMVFICLSEYLAELLNAEGDTKISTIIMTLGVFLNTILDYLLIFPLNLGVLGASLGTCLSYVITTAVFAYIYLIRNNHLIKFNFKEFNLDWEIIREILINSVPVILVSLVLSISGIILMIALKDNAPPITVFAFVLILRIQMFLSTAVQGFSKSCSIVIGHLFGAKRFRDVKKQLNYAIDFSIVINILISIIFLISLTSVVGFFTDEIAVIDEVKFITFVMIVDLVLYAIIFNTTVSLVAIGHSKKSFYSLLIKVASMIVFVYLLCNLLHFGRIGVAMSVIFSDGFQSIYSYFIFMHHVSKADNNSKDEITENPTV